MPVDFSFGQMVAVCSAMQDIAPSKLPAFTSRLKHLMQAMTKAQEAENRTKGPGRGRVAKFSFSQLMRVVIALELIQAGTPPALAARLVEGNWTQLRVGVYFGLYNEVEKRAAGDPREETYWVLMPEALRELSKSGESSWDHYEAFESIYRTDDLAMYLASHSSTGMRGHYRRQVVLNGTVITRAAAFIISFEMGRASIEELRDELYREIKDDEARLEKALEELDLKSELQAVRAAKLDHPYFRDFDERMKARVMEIVPKLTDAQAGLLTAEEGTEVDIIKEDILALRQYDLIAVSQGEIVRTELGSYVADELRRKAKVADHLSERSKRRLDLSIENIGRMQKAGLLGGEGQESEGDADGDR
jgi:hypothetical protein